MVLRRLNKHKNIPFSDPVMSAKAEQLVPVLGIYNFKTNTGWLSGFKDRNHFFQNSMR